MLPSGETEENVCGISLYYLLWWNVNLYTPQEKFQFKERIIRKSALERKTYAVFFTLIQIPLQRGANEHIFYTQKLKLWQQAHFSLYTWWCTGERLADSHSWACQSILCFGLSAMVHGLSSALQLRILVLSGLQELAQKLRGRHPGAKVTTVTKEPMSLLLHPSPSPPSLLPSDNY